MRGWPQLGAARARRAPGHGCTGHTAGPVAHPAWPMGADSVCSTCREVQPAHPDLLSVWPQQPRCWCGGLPRLPYLPLTCKRGAPGPPACPPLCAHPHRPQASAAMQRAFHHPSSQPRLCSEPTPGCACPCQAASDPRGGAPEPWPPAGSTPSVPVERGLLWAGPWAHRPTPAQAASSGAQRWAGQWLCHHCVNRVEMPQVEGTHRPASRADPAPRAQHSWRPMPSTHWTTSTPPRLAPRG